MANILLPTSKAQVSGYKFLMRRAQHGVVLGDIRMIHDPLARRHRALYAGAAMATVLGLGAGAMAVLNPAINPGEAPIVASESGALYVRIDATLHPVTNLARRPRHDRPGAAGGYALVRMPPRGGRVGGVTAR